MEEIWMPILGTGDRYSISNFGAVRSNWSDIPQRNLTYRKRIEKQKLLKCWDHNGYRRVALGRNNFWYVHRLVAIHFLDNPFALDQIDHIDGNRANNLVSNLRWVSPKENTLYGGERHAWYSQKIASAKRRIYESHKTEYQALVNQGHSLRQIAKLFGTSHSTIKRYLKS